MEPSPKSLPKTLQNSEVEMFVHDDDNPYLIMLGPSQRYKLAYSFNYSSILDPVIENNYQLFMVERLILAGAKTFVKTFKEDEKDLSLTDDPKKNTKNWQIPIYTVHGDER